MVWKSATLPLPVAVPSLLYSTRMADSAGRALSNVADEVRALVDRGTEALHDVQLVHDDIRPSLQQLSGRVEQLRAGDAELGGELGKAQALAQESSTRIQELGESARKLSETDPETARSLARAVEHARGLLTELAQLRGEAQHRLASMLLKPLAEPLLRMLGEVGVSPSEGDDSHGESS